MRTENDSPVPDLLIIGHATRDLLPNGGWRLGGTVAFAALTAQRLGLRPAIVTSGPPDVLAALEAAAPDIPVAALPCAEATTFENRYEGEGRRRQYVRGRAAVLGMAAVPAAWHTAPLVLLAPLAQEVDAALASAFPGARVAATPQGWLRRWDGSGLVRPGPWVEAEQVLPHLSALILSREDLIAAPAAADPAGASEASDAARAPEALIAAWARLTPLVVLTQGAAGADLVMGETRQHFPAYPVEEIDPTGAGDVFATAFLCHLWATGDPGQAAHFANCTASFAVQREGTAGIPSRAQVEARMRAAAAQGGAEGS